jgi:hypothetical protein
MTPRARNWLHWTVIGCLAPIVLAPFILVFVVPVVDTGVSAYLIWHRGFGLACTSQILAEAPSPSGRWLARARLVSCGGVPGSQSADVVLVPNVLIPLAVRYTTIFNRNIESNTRQRGDRLTVRWVDDHSLELQGVPCPPCQSQGHHEPCDGGCMVLSHVSGVAVSVTSVEN